MTQVESGGRKKLSERIEKLRAEMYELADRRGSLTVTDELQEKSRELDALVCRYIRRYGGDDPTQVD